MGTGCVVRHSVLLSNVRVHYSEFLTASFTHVPLVRQHSYRSLSFQNLSQVLSKPCKTTTALPISLSFSPSCAESEPHFLSCLFLSLSFWTDVWKAGFSFCGHHSRGASLIPAGLCQTSFAGLLCSNKLAWV